MQSIGTRACVCVFIFSVCWGLVGGGVYLVTIVLEVVSLKHPSSPVFLAAIFHRAKFSGDGFGRKVNGQIIAGISVHVVVEAAEVFAG